MKALAVIALLLVVMLVSLSAYLRLAHSGIGCADWPACYGRIGEVPVVAAPMSTEDAYQKLVDESGKALAWATPLHRLVASVLGLLVVFMMLVALRQKKQRLLCFLLLALTVYLAVLGIRSGSLHDPAVVMGNLAGGFAMLGLLGWLVFSTGSRGHPPARVAALTTLAVVALCLQILLGGFTSANFAATSCQTLPDCHGSWWPGPALCDGARRFARTCGHRQRAGRGWRGAYRHSQGAPPGGGGRVPADGSGRDFRRAWE